MSAATMENYGLKAIDAIEAAGCVLGETLGIIETSGTILVTGATGVIGYRVANRLLDAGYPTVRLGARHATKLEEFNLKKGAEIADFCWERDDTYDAALKGVKSVLCTTPYMKTWATRFPAFIKACQRAGVRNFVKISFYHARRSGDPVQDVPLAALHGDCDEYLANSGIPYTIISASHFMSNPMVFQGKEILREMKPVTKPALYYGASMGRGVNYVSPNDVAEVAVRVLLAPKTHHAKEYTLTGPEAITDYEVARILSKNLSKPIMYVEQPLHFFEDMEKKSGYPIWMVRDLVALEKLKASGKEEPETFISKDINILCDRDAETFEDYMMAKEQMSPRERITEL